MCQQVYFGGNIGLFLGDTGLFWACLSANTSAGRFRGYYVSNMSLFDDIGLFLAYLRDILMCLFSGDIGPFLAHLRVAVREETMLLGNIYVNLHN